MDECTYKKPSNIFYSQDSIHNRFRGWPHKGDNIGDCLDRLCSGYLRIDDIKRIEITQRPGDDRWYTLDNRRLWMFHHLEAAGKCDKIPVRTVSYNASLHSRKFTSTGGRKISVRGSVNGVWHRKVSPVTPTVEFKHTDTKVEKHVNVTPIIACKRTDTKVEQHVNGKKVDGEQTGIKLKESKTSHSLRYEFNLRRKRIIEQLEVQHNTRIKKARLYEDACRIMLLDHNYATPNTTYHSYCLNYQKRYYGIGIEIESEMESEDEYLEDKKLTVENTKGYSEALDEDVDIDSQEVDYPDTPSCTGSVYDEASESEQLNYGKEFISDDSESESMPMLDEMTDDDLSDYDDTNSIVHPVHENMNYESYSEEADSIFSHNYRDHSLIHNEEFSPDDSADPWNRFGTFEGLTEVMLSSDDSCSSDQISETTSTYTDISDSEVIEIDNYFDLLIVDSQFEIDNL